MVSYPNACFDPDCPDLGKEQPAVDISPMEALQAKLDLVLEELAKHVVGGSDDGEPWCAECVIAYPCPDAELRERLEARGSDANIH